MNQNNSESETQIKRYGIIMPYLAYENTMFWQRGSLFLIAHSALVGFVSTSIPKLSSYESWASIISSFIISISGIILTIFWLMSLKAGEFWIHHWHTILKDSLEQKAFGDILVFRDFKPGPKYPHRIRARKIALGPVILFFVLWGLSTVYSLLLIFYKFYEVYRGIVLYYVDNIW